MSNVLGVRPNGMYPPGQQRSRGRRRLPRRRVPPGGRAASEGAAAGWAAAAGESRLLAGRALRGATLRRWPRRPECLRLGQPWH
eukprot:scaffold399046_cov32-Prasinocladus_malaysianus.AAC.1